MRSAVRIPVGESGAGPEVAVRRSAARRPGLIMRASLPTEPKRCERRARYTPARFNMASAPNALHRRHADLTGVRPRGGRRNARAFQRQAHRRGLRRTRPATRRRGHEADGVSGRADGEHGPRRSLHANATPPRTSRELAARGDEVWWWLRQRSISSDRGAGRGDPQRRWRVLRGRFRRERRRR
jgi:hypothetical protein